MISHMKRRIFAALPIAEDIAKEILTWQKRHANLPVRWIKLENLHITLVPPWYVTEDELYTATKVIDEAIKQAEPFSVQFGRVLYGPPGGRPRLIWAEGPSVREFNELKSSTKDALLENPQTGFPAKENRPAKLHLTIARFRPNELRNLSRLDEKIDWQFEIDSVQLMESKLQRRGAEYFVLQEFAISRLA